MCITTALLELIYINFANTVKISSLEGVYYFLLFIDNNTKYTIVFTIHQKSRTISKFQVCKVLVENYYNRKIKALQSENSREYTSNSFSKYISDSRIAYKKTVPYILK